MPLEEQVAELVEGHLAALEARPGVGVRVGVGIDIGLGVGVLCATAERLERMLAACEEVIVAQSCDKKDSRKISNGMSGR